MAYPHHILSAPALAVLLLGLASVPATARPAPSPPPSGEVLHLFGPNSVTSNIMPAGPAAGADKGSGTQASSAATNQGSGMTLGQIAHEMFVTGNPAQEGAAILPKGRSGE